MNTSTDSRLSARPAVRKTSARNIVATTTFVDDAKLFTSGSTSHRARIAIPLEVVPQPNYQPVHIAVAFDLAHGHGCEADDVRQCVRHSALPRGRWRGGACK
jgi:hypothetical protein